MKGDKQKRPSILEGALYSNSFALMLLSLA